LSSLSPETQIRGQGIMTGITEVSDIRERDTTPKKLTDVEKSKFSKNGIVGDQRDTPVPIMDDDFGSDSDGEIPNVPGSPAGENVDLTDREKQIPHEIQFKGAGSPSKARLDTISEKKAEYTSQEASTTDF